jgi:glycosyltransferase involved in cell wall biosynthesis
MDSFSLNLKTNRGHWLIPRWLERRRISRIEKDIFEKFDAHFIISERDRRACDPILASQIDVLANGVDCTFWSPLENIDASFDIAFCGNLGYRPNQLAVQYILNELVTADPGLTVIIGGAARYGQKTGRTQGRVTWTGWVDDLRTVYQNALVFVAPITAGSGIQNKVLEAMAQGLPCVVTPFVNEALGAVPDVEVLLADSPQDFLHHIRVLRKDPLLRRQIGTKARAFVQQNYDWRVNTQILVQKIKLSSPS